MNWESLDWEALDRLRENFLSGAAAQRPYWHTITDLECYDATYGERIGWKWDAVLHELRLRGWQPPGGTVLDWGCGSGVAGRRVVGFLGTAPVTRLVVHDHSALACDFAEHRARQEFPGLAAERADYRFLHGDAPIGTLVVSHVLNELEETARADLAELAIRAQAILWVEPGTHADSRALLAWRERLSNAGFNLVAPCTHGAACGLLAPGADRHWCHHFAPPPTGIYADSNWVRFGQRAGIDLRAVPYSFLVCDRRPTDPVALTGASRILGEPRLYKGYAKLFNCDSTGVTELILQRRTDPVLFKELKHARGPLLYRWHREGDRISAAERVAGFSQYRDIGVSLPNEHGSDRSTAG
jgi:hypothetical protein